MVKSGSICQVVCCGNSNRRNPGTAFFRFPTQEERCHVWFEFCHKEALKRHSFASLSRSFRICSDHFQPECFMNSSRRKLVWDAVPTVCQTLTKCTIHSSALSAKEFAKELISGAQPGNEASASFPRPQCSTVGPLVAPEPRNLAPAALLEEDCWTVNLAETNLIIEPYYGGSHKELVDLLCQELGQSAKLITMSDKKWPWRARCSALHFSQIIPKRHNYQVVFTSSVLNLTELLGLRPDLHDCCKIVYFHEHQLIYPIRIYKDRDFQFGYNQIVSCLAADEIIFNSNYNRATFLGSIDTFLKLMPSDRPQGLPATIRPKCRVISYPINFIKPGGRPESPIEAPDAPFKPLHIVWPHRWEHDKNPETFFSVLFELQEQNVPFIVSVVGQTYSTVPEIFEEAKERLASKINHWGFCENKADYLGILQKADVAVSTAAHEFFGVAMLEATYHGCYPLCPNSLVYPEIYPSDHLYSTRNQLKKKLKYLCLHTFMARQYVPKINFDLYSWDHLRSQYAELFSSHIP